MKTIVEYLLYYLNFVRINVIFITPKRIITKLQKLLKL